VGVTGCKLYYPDGETIQHAGGWIEWPLGVARHYGHGERDEGQWNKPRAVHYVTGAALAFRRDVLEAVGLLDEAFWPGYYEDVDFCLSAQEAGYEVWYAPEAQVRHEETTSLTDAAAISTAFHRGRLRCLLKHMPPRRFLDEFAPAERGHYARLAQGVTGPVLRSAYLESIPAAARLLPRRWQADAGTIDEVLRALQQLCLLAEPKAEPFDPSLGEIEFRSTVPLLGPWIARLRSLWYGVAAQWAVRYLGQQQAAVNRQLESRLQRQEAMNQQNVRALVSLAQQLARVLLQESAEDRPDSST
jgi:hypothetical protein